MAQHDIEVILIQVLASHLAMAVFVVDPSGDSVFYNEPAELLLGTRFDETGPMLMDDWSSCSSPVTSRDTAWSRSGCPSYIAVEEGRRAHGRFFIGGLDGARRQLEVTAIPLLGQSGRRLGLPRCSGRRPHEGHVLGHPGLDASPGAETVAYGGNTSCVRWSTKPANVVVLDAGTGIRPLGATIPEDMPRVDVLLTHLHMDHILGLGFFDRLYRPGFEVHIWGPASTTMGLRARLARYLSPPLFPVRLRDLPCELQLHDVPLGRYEIPGFVVHCGAGVPPRRRRSVPARGDGGTLAYLSDHEPALGAASSPGLRSGPRGSTWPRGRPADPRRAVHRRGVPDARRVGPQRHLPRRGVRDGRRARTFVPFHYDPTHDDTMLDRLYASAAEELRGTCPVVPAREGETLAVPAA